MPSLAGCPPRRSEMAEKHRYSLSEQDLLLCIAALEHAARLETEVPKETTEWTLAQELKARFEKLNPRY
jgi:hypothetical protein